MVSLAPPRPPACYGKQSLDASFIQKKDLLKIKKIQIGDSIPVRADRIDESGVVECA